MPICETPLGAIHYTHNGVSTRGPHLVLIHGAGGETRCWPATWRHSKAAQRTVGLAIDDNPRRITNHSIYAIDLPGHGQSTGPALGTIDALADIVEAFIASKQLRHVIVVGHSMGGAIALTIGGRRNARIAGQIIVASAARIPVTDDILSGLKTDFEKTVDFIIKYSFSRSVPPVFPKKAREYTLAAGIEATHADFLACSTFDIRHSLTEIVQPTLVIAAENDRMIPVKFSASLADALPNAELVQINGSGHYPHLERTAATQTFITQFARSLQVQA